MVRPTSLIANVLIVCASSAIAAQVPTTTKLEAGRKGEDVGLVQAWNDKENLFVEYQTGTGWLLQDTHLAVATSPAEIPQTRSGNPVPGRFAYKAGAIGGPIQRYSMPLADIGVAFGESVVIAAHADVGSTGPGPLRQEGAWAAGTPFASMNFAQYFQHTVQAPLDLSLESGSDFITIVQGKSQNVASVLQLTNESGALVTVTNNTTVSPLGGLAITDDYPAAGYSALVSTGFVLNQSFTGLQVGDYLVTNTTAIQGTSVFATDTIRVEVIPPGGNPVIQPLGSYPDGVQVGTSTTVLFTASITNHFAAPAELRLHAVNQGGEPELGKLRDDGTNGDLQANDGVYSGSFVVVGAAEGVLQYRAKAQFPGVPAERSSPVYSLIVTQLPTTVATSDFTKMVFDSVSQQSMLCDEVLVTFTAPKTDAEVQAFAGLFGAAVAGTVPGLGMYQLKIPNPACTASALLATINAMSSMGDVESAAPNLITNVQEVTPNDPRFGSQYGPQKVRADEAWVISRGGAVIAIVDTGVDYLHEDLAGKVIKGPDLVNNDNDPADDNGHGTHCAGIAAAWGDNGKGIAGIAWNSKVLAVKVANAQGNITFANGVAGIKASADQGSKIISCSWGYPPTILNTVTAWLFGLEGAVNYATAKGALVVCAAGNEGSTAIRLPGRYASAFCVGSTNQSDGRSSFSNFGAPTDIAAPGTSILSCKNGGGYVDLSGTSMATPSIAGCAAVVWARFPAWSAGQVRQRLTATATPLPSLQLGAGRVDLFEAVFNGSFEDDVAGWTSTGTSGSVPSLGPIKPTDGNKMGFISSGPDATQIESTIEQSFVIQPGVTSFELTFDYDFVTEEYPEFVGTIFNDNMTIVLVPPGGAEVQLAYEDVNTSTFSLVSGINFPGGDDTVGRTGWKTVTKTIPVTSGPGTYKIRVRDEGDGIYDSNVLIDKIQFK